jgi:hypothetical protein
MFKRLDAIRMSVSGAFSPLPINKQVGCTDEIFSSAYNLSCAINKSELEYRVAVIYLAGGAFIRGTRLKINFVRIIGDDEVSVNYEWKVRRRRT